LPVFASEVLHGGPETLGWLMAASGCGALVGTLVLSGQRSLGQSAATITVGAAVAGSALALFALSDALWLSLALLFVTGFGVMVQLASSNALIQTIVADDRRGGVMGLYTMAFVGLAPAGTLLAGTLAARPAPARRSPRRSRSTARGGSWSCRARRGPWGTRLTGRHALRLRARRSSSIPGSRGSSTARAPRSSRCPALSARSRGRRAASPRFASGRRRG